MSRSCFDHRSSPFLLSALLLAWGAAFFGACSGSARVDPRNTGFAGAGEAGADNGGADSATTLEFLTRDQLRLKPKQSKQLTVQTTPPGAFPIRFALVGEDAADAVLEGSEVESDADGVAHVTLIAPSRPASFDVRASTASAAQVVYQSVKVDASGVTSLRVRPSYNGHRHVTEWTATATARNGVTCADFVGNPPPDGDRVKKAKSGDPLVLGNIPVGLDVAVTVRAEHYIGGCVTLPALSEVDGNQVLVYASDRPMNLAATDLSLSLGATDPHPEFDKLLQESASLAESALLGSAKNDVVALLDGMRDATSAANRNAFIVARTQHGWDSALESAFGKSAARRMRDPAQRWLRAGLLALDAPNALIGNLHSLGSGSGVTFTPSQVGAATPSKAGFPSSFTGTWSADSSDTLLLGIDLNWQPSRLVTALAVAPALLELPGATSVERALSLSVDCAQVGQVLLAYGTSPGSAAFASCDQNCAVTLCNNAVAAAWGQARLSSAEISTLSVTASGTAEVGDDAEAVALTGSWVGELRTDSGTAAVSGVLSASSTSAP